jgi:aminoglycoside phosphotransferase (APT) family kinase protein
VLDANDLTKIIGVLDWEMSTVGDPLMDLGCTLAYWINHDDPDDKQMMRMYPTNLPGSMTRKELAARYGEKTGLDVSNMLFYYCYALFKVAVIAQQIYFRYAKGFTKDERFAKMIMYVHVLSSVAVQASKKGTI